MAQPHHVVLPASAQLPSCSPLRVGWFRYLNCAPLRWALDRPGAVREAPPGGPQAALATGALATGALATTPELLAEALLDGRLDVAPISLIEYLAHARELLLLPGLAIASDGPVMSCHLISRRPPAGLGGRTVALTSVSRTTVALARLALDLRFGVRPRYRILTGELPAVLRQADAAVVIGDAALVAGQQPPDGTQVHDLGDLWRRWTGQPMVFAVWAVRRDVATAAPEAVAAVLTALLRARDVVEDRVDEAAAALVPGSPVGADVLAAYFRALRYRLGLPELAGVRRFAELAACAGFIPRVPDLEAFTTGPVEPVAATT